MRLYKTRTMAASACTAGKVRIGDQPVKAARGVRVGEVITAITGEVTRTIKVTGLIEQRVSAPLVVIHAALHRPNTFVLLAISGTVVRAFDTNVLNNLALF